MNLSEFHKKMAESRPILTDKGTIHSYIDNYYSPRFTPLKEIPIVMLEIGIFQGGSSKLWKNWFNNVSIYGMDNKPNYIEFYNKIGDGKGISIDAYCKKALNMFKDEFFDIIIEDGPHTVDSQIYTAKNWSKKLKKNGILIIEDIQDISHVDKIVNAIPKNYNFSIFDLRSKIGRYDDIIIEITKT